jgi:hypothetical protein
MAFSTSRRGGAEDCSGWSSAAFILAVPLVSGAAGDRKAAATVTGLALAGRFGDGAPESFEGDAEDRDAGGRLGSSGLGVTLGAGGLVRFVPGSSG